MGITIPVFAEFLTLAPQRVIDPSDFLSHGER